MYAGSYLLPWREPKIVKNNQELAAICKERGIAKLLVVTDAVLAGLGLMNPLLEVLEANNIAYTIYDQTTPNPTTQNVEQALAAYKMGGCRAIIGFGGGSAIDCAKAVAARLAKPNKSVNQLKGLFKILKRTPTTFAIPTTSGTGSEATVASVIVDPQTHHKYAINDLSLIPHYAMLDVNLTLGLPPHITATTGMDALTHAVEAYIGHSNTRKTRKCAEEAVQLIFKYLEAAYADGGNLQARAAMQRASYLAGVAFTRGYVGNIHAVSHAISGRYGTAHGLANAVVLPVVLEYYGPAAEKPLGRLAQLVGFGSAQALVEEIKAMNARMGIPEQLDGIREEDFTSLATYAEKEANPLYPVPVLFTIDDFKQILCKVRGDV